MALRHEGRSVSYGELNAQANRLARHLRTLGVTAEQRVAICVERGVEMVVAMLATLKAGGAYVPLDPAYASERLRATLQDSGARVVLRDAAGRAALGEAALHAVELDGSTSWSASPDDDVPVAETGASPSSLAYVIYTSGSTGVPRA